MSVSDVYLHYADDAANANVLHVYQQISEATNARKRVRWKFYQYDTGNSWDQLGAQLANSA